MQPRGVRIVQRPLGQMPALPPTYESLLRLRQQNPQSAGASCFVPLFRSMQFKPSWCEENVYRIAKAAPPTSPCVVIFISNKHKSVLMHNQTTDPAPLTQRGKSDTVLYWDYHVIMICRCESRWMVYDTSTTLGRPVTLEKWLQETFPREDRSGHNDPRFRLVDRAFFVKDFSSDRTDMRGQKIDRAYWPEWPLIQANPSEPSNLHVYTDMSGPNAKGPVVDLDGLVAALYEHVESQ